MSDNFVVFLTSDNCGHCQHTRGNGILNDGKVLNSVNFLEKIFQHNLEVVNVHYINMMGKKSNIREVTRFYKKDKEIFQERFTSDNGRLKNDVYKAKGDKNLKIFSGHVLEKGSKTSWDKFLQDRIPNKLSHYVFYFPCFLIINRQNWFMSIKDQESDLIALTNAGITFRDKKGNVGLKKTSESINKRNVDIIKLIEDVTNGKVKIAPMEDLKIEEEKKVEVPMESFIEYKDVVIKGA